MDRVWRIGVTVQAMASASPVANARSAEVIRFSPGSRGPLGLPVDLAEARTFELGGLAIDPVLRQLAYPDGSSETLEPRVMETFVALHRAEGAVMSRDDLIRACWRGTVVGEDAVQRVIQRLRKVATRAGTFRIDTITKVGYRLVADSGTGADQRGDAPSLAVLPFTSRSDLPADTGLTLGMAEDLIEALALGVNLRVLASSATARFHAAPVADLQELGRQLGVRYFLEGHLRRAGDDLRVTAQLVEAETGTIAWQQRFEQPLDRFAALQGALVSEVANALGASLYKLEMDRALRKPANLTAWECVARALAAIREYGAEPLLRAIAESQRAIEIAPDYGLAHAIHAQCVSGAYLSISLHDPQEEDRIQRHIDHAHALDPDHAGVLAAIATASCYIGRPAEGLPRALRAIRLRPGHGLAHYAAGVARLLLGEERAGIEHLDDFLVVEPESHLHYITHAWRGIALTRLGDFAAARAAFDENFALYPGNFIARLILTGIDYCEQRHDAARANLAEAVRLEPGISLDLHLARIGRFFAGSARLPEMRGALEALWAG